MDHTSRKKCLTLLGTASIQEYVFRSNRLTENAGASYLVASALDHWKTHSGMLFVGGGNAAVIFDELNKAVDAVKEWTFGLLKTAPGLRVTAAHEEYEDGHLNAAFQVAQQKLFEYENRPPRGWDLGALPVVRTCPSTGLAANDYHKKSKQWMSVEAIRKREAGEAAHTDLSKRYADCLNKAPWTSFPSELDQLTGDGEGASQIAIVHADGNGIGKLFSNLNDQRLSDDEFRAKIRDLSLAVNTIARKAFQETLTQLRDALPALKEKYGIEPQGVFPVRPIVDGGDDLTFVCHGRLGLMLAARYLQNFENKSADSQETGKLSACAGVLIMPQKFPFARGYELAEALCAKAKQKRRAKTSEGSWLDFQILIEGSAGSLDCLRNFYGEKLYRNKGRQLLTRPYALDGKGDGTWTDFEKRWKESQRWPRSWAKALLEALARGKDYAGDLLREFASRGYVVENDWEREISDNGKKTKQSRTAWFDPIEALDFYVPWPDVKKENLDAQTADQTE